MNSDWARMAEVTHPTVELDARNHPLGGPDVVMAERGAES